MKTIFLLTLFMSLSPAQIRAAQCGETANANSVFSAKDFSRKDLEQQIGRKLTLKERIVFKLFGKKISKSLAKVPEWKEPTLTLAYLSFVPFVGFVCSIAGIFHYSGKLKKIKANPALSGRAIAQKGRKLCIIALVLWLALLGLSILLIGQ